MCMRGQGCAWDPVDPADVDVFSLISFLFDLGQLGCLLQLSPASFQMKKQNIIEHIFKIPLFGSL
jgi:hypothetical protein